METPRETVTRTITLPITFTMNPEHDAVQAWLGKPVIEQDVFLRSIIAGIVNAIGSRGSFFAMEVAPHFARVGDPMESLLDPPDDPTPPQA